MRPQAGAAMIASLLRELADLVERGDARVDLKVEPQVNIVAVPRSVWDADAALAPKKRAEQVGRSWLLSGRSR